MRIVDYQLCTYDIAEHTHTGIHGMAKLNGRESILMEIGGSSSERIALMQHELSHNIGALDIHSSTDGVSCVMKHSGPENEWCDVCAAAIINSTYNN